MKKNITKERREAYIEVLEILKHMDSKYVKKIPKDLIQFFKNNSSKEYKFHLDNSIPLEEQKLKEITINVLAMINLNYWCESEEHKKELLYKYYKNEVKYEEELRKKYSANDLFKNEKKVITTQKDIENLPQYYEEPKWYEKLYETISRFIRRVFE